MQYITLVSLLIAIASTASAAECVNCSGNRIVGTGPVRWACPMCDGMGSIPDPVSADSAVAAAPAPGRPRPAVARITAADGRSRVAGSGVLVDRGDGRGVVLTNWHVVRAHRDGLTVTWPNGSQSPGRVIAWDDAWDLAALAVARPAAEPVAIAAAAPRLGDPITIAGYGPDGRYLEQTGAVTQYLSPMGSHTRQFVEVRATARQGDSGGPMFSADGELAGVLFGSSGGYTAGSCSTRLRTFLTGVPEASDAVLPTGATTCQGGRCQKR